MPLRSPPCRWLETTLATGQLEMMIAACHDFAEEAISVQTPAPEAETPSVDAEFATDEEPLDEDVTPIFGSRRAAAGRLTQDAQANEPLFTRRREALG